MKAEVFYSQQMQKNLSLMGGRFIVYTLLITAFMFGMRIVARVLGNEAFMENHFIEDSQIVMLALCVISFANSIVCSVP